MTLEFLTLAALCAKVDAAGPRRYLIRGIWPSGTYGVHAAEMKAQKTWNADDLAVSVASNTPWLGHFPIDDPGPVIMFMGEGGESSTVRRLRAICEDRGLHAEDLPITVCVRAPHLQDRDHMAQFERKIEETRPRLVTLDPLYLSAGDAESGSIYKMGAVLETPQLICAKYDASLFVVTHFNRSKKSGAGRISGAGPAEWGRVLIGADVKSRHTDPETRATTVVTLVDILGGEVADQAFRVKRHIVADNPDDLDSPLHYTVEIIPQHQEGDTLDDMPPARRKLIEAIYVLGRPVDRHEIVDWIVEKYGHGLKRQTVSTELNAALDDGLVDRIEEAGKVTQWFPAEGVSITEATPTRHLPTGDAVGGVGVSSFLERHPTPDTPSLLDLDDDTWHHREPPLEPEDIAR